MSYLAEKLMGSALVAVGLALGFIAYKVGSEGHYVEAIYVGALATIPSLLGSGFLAAGFERDGRRFERFRDVDNSQ